MRSDSERRIARLLVLMVLLVTSQLAVPVFASAQTATLTDSDRDLLNRVRQAGLWEMPAGDMARTRAEDPHVQDVGRTLMTDHGRLDVQVRELAAKYNVVLPSQPNADQQSWLAELRKATSSSDFERIFANRLRAAHGVIFGVIAQVRAGTRNDDIRAFAATANQVVLRHITLLESTGLVDYTALPQPTVSTTAATSAASALNLGSMDILTTVVLALLVCGATLLLLWLIRNSARRRHRSGEKNAANRNPEPAKEPVA
jgi:predicted outer membrane protein